MSEQSPARGVVFGCVAEPTPRFYGQALRLLQSIRWFGGALAGADVFVCFVGEPDPDRRAELEALGAQVRLVELFSPLNRYSNKVRFFELPELARYETAVLLDCDVALVQDPTPYLAQPALQLMLADLPTVPSARLAWLCERFGLAAPAPSYRTTCSQEPTIWYCNTGVMIMPTAWIGRVLPRWREYIMALCAEPELLDPPFNHCNQAAMALTYLADPLPFAELPVAMNFPLHQTGRRPSEAMLREDPVILHYHDRVDADGLLLPVPYPLAQARAEQLNQRLRASLPARPEPALAQPAPLPFVVGAGRSGAKLLGEVLASHPDLALLPAIGYIPALAQACQRASRPAERFVEWLVRHPRWAEFQVGAQELRAAISALEPFGVGAGLRALYRLYAAGQGKPRCGDATAANGLHAGQIAALLPEARFVQIVRAGPAPGESAHEWAAQVHAVRRQQHELAHYLELRYDDLLSAPEPALRQICAFLELSWRPALLERFQEMAGRAGAGQAQGEPATPSAPARQVAVCITGMHRSGTSLIAQILHGSGPYLGPYARLAAPAADNLDGYWEHPDIQQLNDELLAHFGGGWDLAPSLPEGWADLPDLEPLRQRARALIAEFGGQPAWGWKDPRSALTMPFWRRLIPELKVVICVRSPLEVAQSLARRGMSSPAFGMRLWQTYYQRLLAAVPPEQRIVTHYDAYFADAAAETSRVLSWLGLPVAPALVEQACAAASGELRHHRGTAASLLEGAVPAAVLQLYGWLCDEAAGAGAAALAGAGADADVWQPDDAPAGALALVRAQAELAQLRPALAASQTELAVLRPVLEARETELAQLAPLLAAREAELAGHRRELAALRELVAAREGEIGGYTSELAALRELVAAREGELAGWALVATDRQFG